MLWYVLYILKCNPSQNTLQSPICDLWWLRKRAPDCCYWLPAPHYCTFQLTPLLSFLSWCAMMYFVRMMKITMKMKKQISSWRGGHIRATIFVFRMRVSAVPSLPHSYGHIFCDEGYIFRLFQNSRYLKNLPSLFLATLVALHFTPVSKSVGRQSFRLA